MNSTLRAPLEIVLALLIAGVSASALDEITVSLSGNVAAATVSPVTLAGDMIDNVFVPRIGNALPESILIAVSLAGLAGWRERRKSQDRRREERCQVRC
jgi:hypothetical protein